MFKQLIETQFFEFSVNFYAIQHVRLQKYPQQFTSFIYFIYLYNLHLLVNDVIRLTENDVILFYSK